MTLQNPLFAREGRVTSFSSGWLLISSWGFEYWSEGTEELDKFMLVDMNTHKLTYVMYNGQEVHVCTYSTYIVHVYTGV